MRLHRVVVSWAGPQVVGRAVNVLHFDATEQAAPDVAAIRGAYSALLNGLPNGVSIQVPNSGDTIEDSTGALTGVWSAPDQTALFGGGSAGAAAGVGACVSWNTGAIVTGSKGPRKLRGKTFLVPLSKDVYDTDGTLIPGEVTILQNFATGMLGVAGFGIWHRPTKLAPSSGTSGGVVSSVVHDKVAFLSSRRQ